MVTHLTNAMEQKVNAAPSFLNGVAIHETMTMVRKHKAIEKIKSGELHFLYISPEFITGSGMFSSILPFLPPIAFVCMEDAHCVSHWSHNFKPSYLRLCKIIREKLGVNTILGLTSTAPESLTRTVAGHLGVSMDDVIRLSS